MATCRSCGGNFSFFEISGGVCQTCYETDRQACISCKRVFNNSELSLGQCRVCEETTEKSRGENAQINEELASIVLTTEMATNLEIEERLEIITAECVFGMNLFKDFFAGVRDIFGGRSDTTQNVLRDARKTVLNELKREAFTLGANAVIAVDINYSEFSGTGKSMLFVVASGTAVKVKL